MTKVRSYRAAHILDHSATIESNMDHVWRLVENRLTYMEGPLAKATTPTLNRIAKALRYVGDWFEANPEKFVQSTERFGHRVCSIGLLNPSVRGWAGIDLVPPPAIPPRATGIVSDLLVNLNDTHGMTPKRLAKVNHQVADILVAWSLVPKSERSIGAFEALVHKTLGRRAAKASFNRNKKAKLALAGK